MTRHALRLLLLGAMCSSFLVPAGPAAAGTFRVTILGDPSPGVCDARCSLREAVIAANASPGPDVIRLPKGRVELSRAGAGEEAGATGDLDVTDTLTIVGAGMGRSVVDGNDLDRVFDASSGTFVLRRLTVTGGHVETGGATAFGGGIRGWGALVRLREVAVRGNDAADGGGGVAGFTVEIQRSLIAGNRADSAGAVDGSTVKIADSLLLGNRATLSGGAMALFFGSTVELRNTTVAGNTSGHNAGGIGINSGSALLLNVTVHGNHTDGDAGAPGGNGGGVQVNAGSTMEIRNTIISGNTDGAPTAAHDCAGDLTSLGSSLVRDQNGCSLTGASGDLPAGTDPRLRPLANNGGATRTLALPPGSPARNAGAACLSKDQRGVPRSLGGACDIGAYELVSCFGRIVNRVGTQGNDVLRGTGRKDGFLGFGGRDRLIGRGGSDGMCGNGGRDTLEGGPGRDRLHGGPGRDLCVGGPGRDRARSCERRREIP
ncbi:MAG TPA: choice-of-anchor Q domain-containing protein [Actinomycetota bacterium]